MQLAMIVATSAAVAATRSRKAKVAALAACLEQADPAALPVVVSYLGGALLQRRTGLGWRSLTTLPGPAAEPALEVAEVDAAFERISRLAGAGSGAARAAAVTELFGRATVEEQTWLRGVVTGEVRQGALDSLVQEALAVAAGVPLGPVRRAAMLAGSTVAIAAIAFVGEDALAEVGLVVGRPVLPMLAASAPSVEAALAKLAGPVAVDAKLDGIRIQVHRDGDDVLIATRTLDDITARLPEVVEVTRSLPVRSCVLDGEAMTLGADGRPRPFQETASRTATRGAAAARVAPYFFDVLHVDGRDLLDLPLGERLAVLDAIVPETHRVERLVVDAGVVGVTAAETFAAEVLRAGHEGVVVKSLDAAWEAGRRGSGWVKVKPVHTLDLVVIAVEWGSGRRRGWLSNIHLAARDPDTGDLVMLGKTFKGMTDEMLAWQTERFLELETRREGHVVHVRPEQVVEIAFDGLQRSTRYPGGLALRFARVVRYRDDKTAADADTIETVRALS
jgi:DNA ligase-1